MKRPVRAPGEPARLPASLFLYFYSTFLKHNKKYSKHSTKKKMRHATALWLNLSTAEKDKVEAKYEQAKKQYKVDYASYLSRLQPYFKKKQDKLHKNNQEINENVSTSLNDANPEDAVIGEHADHSAIRSEAPPNEIIHQLALPPLFEEPPYEILQEPVPPPRDAKELFMMTQEPTIPREECVALWTSLSNTHKIRYRAAAKSLKEEYMQKYNIYLHSLSNYELFLHLKKT